MGCFTLHLCQRVGTIYQCLALYIYISKLYIKQWGAIDKKSALEIVLLNVTFVYIFLSLVFNYVLEDKSINLSTDSLPLRRVEWAWARRTQHLTAFHLSIPS